MNNIANDLAEGMQTALVERLMGSAEWRNEKASEYPDDEQRNLCAADRLDRLAREVAALPVSSFSVYCQLHARAGEDHMHVLCDVEEEAIRRAAGFHDHYDSGAQFMAELTEEMHATLDEALADLLCAEAMAELREEDDD